MKSDYSPALTNEQILYVEGIYEGRDITKNKGLDYYGNTNSLEKKLAKELDDLLTSFDDENTTVPCKLIKPFDLTNLSNYDRVTMKKMGIKVEACLDFIDIKFTTTMPQDRSIIKKYLTEKTGIKHFIKVIHEHDEVLENDDTSTASGTTFVIRLHDIKSIKNLFKRLNHLKYYNSTLNPEDFEIVGIERAIDFYNASQLMCIALFKAVQLNKAEKCRAYNANKIYSEKDKGILKLQIGGIEHLYDDKAASFINCNTIYINDKNSDYHLRFYFKTTDFNKRQINEKDYRVRFEQFYSGLELLKLNNNEVVTVKDLNAVIRKMSSELRFTKLRNDAFPYFASSFYNFIKPYGLEKPYFLNAAGKKIKRRKNNRSTSMCQYIKSHTEFNQVVRDAQKELAEKFKFEN